MQTQISSAPAQRNEDAAVPLEDQVMQPKQAACERQRSVHLSITGDSYTDRTLCRRHKQKIAALFASGSASRSGTSLGFRCRPQCQWPAGAPRAPRQTTARIRSPASSAQSCSHTAVHITTDTLQHQATVKRLTGQATYHITNGGDISDSHLVYSVPLTGIFIKQT